MPHDQPSSILHVISRLDGYGSARMLRHLAAHQAKRGAHVTVLALQADELIAAELRQSGVAVHDLRRRWPVDPVAIARLRRLRQELSAEVVHAWDPAALLHAAFSRPRGVNERLIETLDAGHPTALWPRVFALARRRVAGFIAPDERVREQLLRQLADARHVQVIRTGADAPSVTDGPSTAGRETIRTQLGWPTNAVVIAMAGPLERRKQLDEAIWCFELLRVLHEQTRLLILGEGPDRTRLEEFAQQVSEPDCVRFLGYRTDGTSLLRHADVFWQLDAGPSTPWALVEAMAAGAPIVASDTPPHRAAITDGHTGRLAAVGSRAEVGRATDDFIRDPALAKQLGAAAAIEAATHWSLDAALAAYDAI